MTAPAQSHQQLNQSNQLNQRLRQSFAANKQNSINKQNSANKQDSANQTQPLSTQDKLTLFEQALTEVEAQNQEVTQAQEAAQNQTDNVLAQAIPQATLQATDDSNLNPIQAATSLKEAETSISPDIGPVEAGAGLQQVEYEKTPEIPPEVESYLKSVEDSQDQAPPEITVADGTHAISDSHQPLKKPVVVLPITPEQEKKGKKKSVHWSIRWLVEWSQRLMKMFKGEIIYRHAN